MKKIYTKLNVLFLIGAFIIFSGSLFAQNINIASGATVTIAPGASITGGVLNNSGTLTIQSDANGTGSLLVNSSTTGGTPVVNVERYLPSTNWHIVSCPVVGQDKSNFGSTNSIATKNSKYAIGTYNTSTDGWEYWDIASTGSFSSETGYSVLSPAVGAVTFTGTDIYTGTHNKGVGTDKFSWNAVGNPYTTAIWAKGASSPDKDFLTENDGKLDASYKGLYVWDQSLNSGAGDYTVIANSPFPSFPGNESELAQDKIAVGQGFIIRAKSGVTSVAFAPEMQVHAPATPFKSAEMPVPAVRLTATSGNLVNRAVVSFNPESTLGLDPGYDVGKLKGNSNIALYTQLADGSSDVDFIYQSVEDKNYELLTIPVGLDLKNGGEVTFTLETSEGFPTDLKVYLEDKATHTTTQFTTSNSQYSVAVPKLKGYGRFNLLFTNSVTGIDSEQQGKTAFNVFTRDRLIFVNGPADNNTRFSVYGINGKMWYQNRAEATNQNTINAAGFAAGVYLIKIDKPESTQTLKVVLTK